MSGTNAQTFISHLDSAFLGDPLSMAVFRLAVSSGTMSWAVSGDTITVTSSANGTFTGTLSTYTIDGLVQALLAAGFAVSSYDPANALLSAAAIMDGSGSVNDALQAYTSFLWAMGEALGVELQAAGVALDDALKCAVMLTAEDVWLDLWGSYFNVLRQGGEPDDAYARRIVVEVMRPRSNNVAIELALESMFLQQGVQVVDVMQWGPATPQHDGTIKFDGTHTHNSTAKPLYGLFDVQVGYDLLSGSNPASFIVLVQAIVNRMRAAGTYLRNLTLLSSAISDVATDPVDGAMALAVTAPFTDAAADPVDGILAMAAGLALGSDPVAAQADTLTLTIHFAASFLHDGKHKFDGSLTHNSGTTEVDTL